MSLSKPFFNSSRSYVKRNKYVSFMDDKAFLELHWTKQQELRPLSSQKRWINNTDVDYDTRIDNFDTDDDYNTNDKEITT